MRQKFLIIGSAVLISCALFGGPLAYSEEAEVAAEPYLCEGDTRLFNNEMVEAREIYEFVLQQSPDSYGALWRLSRLYVSYGMAAKKARDKKKKWKEAEEYARRAVMTNPDGAEGHLYTAVALGKLALHSPPSEKIKFSWEIKEEAEKAMELNSDEQKAYLVLGAWHRNVATASSLERQLARMFFEELPQGTLEESLEFLLKSVSLGGVDVKNYYELALTYEAMGDYEAAKREYNNALAARLLYPEDRKTKAEIKKTLRKSRYN